MLVFTAENQMKENIMIDSLQNKDSFDLKNIYMMPALISADCFKPIFFKKNTNEFKDTIALDFLLFVLNDNPNIIIELNGYCAPDEDNISKDRVCSVKKFLIKHGIKKSRIIITYSDFGNRPYFEKKCGSIPYYIMNEPTLIINQELIESTQDASKREFLRNLMRCVLIKIHSC